MQQLTNAEEQLMEPLETGESLYERFTQLSRTKTKTTTVATLLKRMIDKDFVAYTEFGNSREYYPLVPKNSLFLKTRQRIDKEFFNDSASQFASSLPMRPICQKGN
jgi:predicted transcriptional regulator